MRVREISENAAECQTNEINYRQKRKRCSFQGVKWVVKGGYFLPQVGGLSKATIMPKSQSVCSRQSSPLITLK